MRAAQKARYGIEIDVQLASCGEAVVFHDDRLDRLTAERGPLRTRSARELRRITLANSAETIPTLAEVLDLVGGRAPLLVEIKDQDGALGDDVGPLEARVAGLLSGYSGDVAVMSFNPNAVAAFAVAAPAIPRGLTTCGFEADEWPHVPPERRSALAAFSALETLRPGFISHDHRDLARPALTGIRAHGLPVLCWTIRSPEEEQAARAGADNITFEGYLPDLPSA